MNRYTYDGHVMTLDEDTTEQWDDVREEILEDAAVLARSTASMIEIQSNEGDVLEEVWPQ